MRKEIYQLMLDTSFSNSECKCGDIVCHSLINIAKSYNSADPNPICEGEERNLCG